MDIISMLQENYLKKAGAKSFGLSSFMRVVSDEGDHYRCW